MRASLKATTAILASLTLVMPSSLPAQTGVIPPAECTDENSTSPCATDLPGGAAAAPEAESEVEMPETEGSEAAGKPTAQPESEAAAPEEQPAGAAPEPTPEPTIEEAPEAAPEEAVSEPATETEAAPDPKPETNEAVEAPEEAEAAPEEAAGEPATETEAAPEPKPETDEAIEAPEAEAPEKTPAPEAAPVEGSASTETGSEAPVQTPAPQARPAAEDTAGVVPNPGETAAAQATTDDPDVGEMETETVTEENARSSDEDFVGEINAEANAAAKSSDNGLSKFEKALLLGAGALAVGAIVRGNREVIGTSQDRLVVSGSDGTLEVLKDDNALLRQPGSEIQTRTYDDGSTRTITTRTDGSQVITVRDADLRVIRRVLVRTDGTEVMLIDDTAQFEPVDVSLLPPPASEVRTDGSEDELRAALEREGAFNRQFSLSQIRQISEVRKLAPAIQVDTITFETGSAAIQPEQANDLTALGKALTQLIRQNPNEVFLVEGHTDAVGSASTNLILSDRRAESLALALTEYFDVPPENLVVQGYGESDLRVATETAERANRRAGVRRITQLMQVAAR